MPPIEQRTYDIEGQQLSYPTIFDDGAAAAGLFVVDANAADERIAASGFKTARIAPGKAIFSLTCVDYRDTQCGVYHEIAMSFFVDPFPSPGCRIPYLSTLMDIVRGQVRSYTWVLPVTTALSCEAGKQMWGFPKTIEQIDFEDHDGQATFTLTMQGTEVLRYTVKSSGDKSPPVMHSPVYSNFEGAPHVGTLTQEFHKVGYSLRGGTLELGDHALATELRALGVGKHPLLATWLGKLSFNMSAPHKL
jgi:hypothetical protein